MALSRKARTRLAEQFAEIFRISQDEYRELLNALRDDAVDADEFNLRAAALHDKLVKLKRIRIQLSHERDELARSEPTV